MQRSVIGLGAAVGLAGAAAAAGMFGAAQVVRPPRTEFRDDPEGWGLPKQRIGFRSTDGMGLSAWLFPSPTARASVVLVHGYGASRDFSLPVAKMLWPRFHILAPDLRNHGESAGTRTSVGYVERKDVIASVTETARLFGDPIGVLGVSMGAVATLFAAAEDHRILAVALDSPFASLREVLARAAVGRGYPRRVVPLLTSLTCRTMAFQQRYPLAAADPLRAVGRIAPRPLLIAHGEADLLCDVEHARRLYAAAGEPKQLWLAPDISHAGLYHDLADEYAQRMTDFFTAALER